MDSDALQNIVRSPAYKELVKKRTRFAWVLTGIMLALYFGYIGLIAFNKPFLAQPLGAHTTSLGILVGVGLIICTVALTGIYVHRANKEFDALTRRIVEEAKQ